jgi:hypothetical protein
MKRKLYEILNSYNRGNVHGLGHSLASGPGHGHCHGLDFRSGKDHVNGHVNSMSKKHLPPQLSSLCLVLEKTKTPPPRYWLGKNIESVPRPNFSPR